MNTLFIGFALIAVSVISLRTYLNSGLVRAFMMGGGMLVFGLGSIVAGFSRYFSSTVNTNVTLFNTCAMLGAAANLLAEVLQEKAGPRQRPAKARKRYAVLAVSIICVFVPGLAAASELAITPLFYSQNGATDLRNTVIWLAIAFFLAAGMAFLKQYQRQRKDYLYWYALSLFMLALGLFGVWNVPSADSFQSWAGRFAQYIGGVFALISMADVLQRSQESGRELSAVMSDLFSDPEGSYTSLVNASHDAILSTDGRFNIFMANSSAEKLFGYSGAELTGASVLELLRGSGGDSMEKDIQEHVSAGYTVEMSAKDRGGRVFPCEVSVSSRELASGHVYSFIIRDIGERKRAEAELKRSEALLRAIFEGIDEHMYLKDRQSRMVMANVKVARDLGVDINGILGKTELEYFIDNELARAVMENDRRVMEEDRSVEFEETVVMPHGTRTFLSTKIPWHDTDGTVIGLFGVSRDITERKAMEDALKRTAEELQQKNRLVTEFFVNISHEFRTPLSILLLSVELLENMSAKGLNAGLSKHLLIMRQNAYRLSRLVSNLLDITKIDAGFFEPKPREIDIADFLIKLVGSTEFYAKRKNISLKLKCAAKKKRMVTDGFMLERILLNLISNALKHTPKGGNILLCCSFPEDRAVFSVKDDGAGIPKDMQEIIFDRYRQVDTSFTRRNEGCGIGLALTKSLVDILGGKISLKSAPGAGSEFTVELPQSTATDPRMEAYEQSGMEIEKRIQMEFSDIDFS